MIMKKRMKRKKKNSVNLMLMENLEDVKTLKKKSLKDYVIFQNLNGSSILVRDWKISRNCHYLKEVSLFSFY